MSFHTLVRKAREYYHENGLRDTLQMSYRYTVWRLSGLAFLLKNGSAIRESGTGLKIRGDVDVLGSSEGSMSIGNNVEIAGDFGRSTFFKIGGDLKIADEVFINRGCEIYATTEVVFEYDATVAPGVVVRDSDMHAVDEGEVERAPVKIKRRAWLGTQCIILKGVTVGEDAVVGAGSVVTKDVPPGSIVAGNPAKIIREL